MHGKHRRNVGRVSLGLLAVVALLATTLLPAMASHYQRSLEGSEFEIENDANLKVDVGGNLDWGNVAEDRQADAPSGQNDDSLGEGTKEDTAVPSVVSGSIPPNKSDLLNFGVYFEQAAGGNFLHTFWHRVQEPSGTTNMDFEFNQSETLSANGVTPVRTAGDMLLQYDLSQGGTNPQLFLSKWVATGNKSLCEAANSTPCWGKKVDLTATGDATGSINTSAIPSAESDGLGNVSARTFGEASIDFDALIADPTACFTFGSAYLKSRSSDSFTAALKDFIAPTGVDVTNCGSLKIVKEDENGSPLAGAKFKVYKDDGDGIFEPGTGDVQVGSECTTSSNGTGDCTFSNLFIGDKFWVHETAAPTGYEIAPGQTNPVLVEITSDGVHTVTFVNRPAVGDLRITKSDDAGNLMQGVRFTLVGTSDGGQPVNLDCITDVNGVCSFTGVPVGTYTLDEDATSLPAGYSKDPNYPQQVTITAGGLVTRTATNPRTHKVIVIVCHEGTNTLSATDVVNGLSTKTSLASPPGGITEAQLCGLGGASFGGLGHTDKSLNVKLGNGH